MVVAGREEMVILGEVGVDYGREVGRAVPEHMNFGNLLAFEEQTLEQGYQKDEFAEFESCHIGGQLLHFLPDLRDGLLHLRAELPTHLLFLTLAASLQSRHDVVVQ